MDKLADSPAFDGRPDRAQVEAALERIAHRWLMQRDWDDDRAEVAYREAAEIVESFAATLAPERSERLLRAPDISELLALSGSG